MLTLDDIQRARESVGDRLRHTPLFSSRTLGNRIGAEAFLKAELFQRTGSFKPRGVLTKLASLTREERARGVVGISAGNHAQALAYGAAVEGLDALVVMWRDASAAKIAATRGYGAQVDLGPADPAAAFARLDEVLQETGRTLVHPFDDPAIMAGQGTVGLEIVDDAPEVDVVVVPIGGGGLISGISTAVKALRPDVRVIGVEPESSAAMRLALDAGESVPLTPVSVADGLNAPFAGPNALTVVKRYVDEVVLVTEAEIGAGFRFLYERAKLACEPAGAAATGALLAGKIPLERGETVVAVVSGGNVASQTASAILASA